MKAGGEKRQLFSWRKQRRERKTENLAKKAGRNESRKLVIVAALRRKKNARRGVSAWRRVWLNQRREAYQRRRQWLAKSAGVSAMAKMAASA
jgi:hypothetical protein